METIYFDNGFGNEKDHKNSQEIFRQVVVIADDIYNSLLLAIPFVSETQFKYAISERFLFRFIILANIIRLLFFLCTISHLFNMFFCFFCIEDNEAIGSDHGQGMLAYMHAVTYFRLNFVCVLIVFRIFACVCLRSFFPVYEEEKIIISSSFCYYLFLKNSFFSFCFPAFPLTRK